MSLNVFPSLPGSSYAFTRRPIFSTVIQTAVSGRTTRLPQRNAPVWQWEVDFTLLRSSNAYAEMQQMTGFYLSQLGAGSAFSYQDSEDNSVTSQYFGIGDGSTTSFQLVRSLGGFVENVYLPTGTPLIYINGAQALQLEGGLGNLQLENGGGILDLENGVAYTISASGVVTFATAPAIGAILTWTGGFNWLCYFDDDQFDLTRFALQRWSAKTLKFSSVLLG